MICGHQLALRHLGRKLIKLVRILVLYRSMQTVVCQGFLVCIGLHAACYVPGTDAILD